MTWNTGNGINLRIPAPDELHVLPKKMTECVSECDEDSEDAGPSFFIGQTFKSYEELSAKIEAFEQSKFVQFWKCDARTVEAARKRMDRHLNPVLKYYELKLCCIHGGQSFKPAGKGMRNTS